MKKIGFVSTWFERGAAYVTRQYVDLLKESNEVFIFARGEDYATDDENWNSYAVTWGKKKRQYDERIQWKQFKKWIEDNKLDIVFFNEQREISIVIKTRIAFPDLILGSYIDYYKAGKVKEFEVYDFLICNTLRHYSAFSWHKQCFYVKWGTDTELFKPKGEKHDELVFFHSAGRTTRKGTIPLIKVFTETDLWKRSRLVLHTQVPAERFTNLSRTELEEKNIELIEETIPAPGAYYRGDVYVYPAELDGLGLTIYEALSSGLPVIGTDIPPINEIITNGNGRLIKVSEQQSRPDGYFWPISIIDEESLYKQMSYFIESKNTIEELKRKVRKEAEQEYNWSLRKGQIEEIFSGAKRITGISEKDWKTRAKNEFTNGIARSFNDIKMNVKNLLVIFGTK